MRQSNNTAMPSDVDTLRVFKERLARLVAEKFDGKHTRLARASGVGASTIQGWIDKEVVNPNGLALFKIAKAGGVSVNWLFGEDDPLDACPADGEPPGRDWISLPRENPKRLSTPEREKLGQALEVLRAPGEGEGYARALEQNIMMLHQGLKAERKAADQSPGQGAGEGSSRAKRARRKNAGN